MLHELDLDALNVGHGLSENSKNFDYYTIRNKETHHLEKIQF